MILIQSTKDVCRQQTFVAISLCTWLLVLTTTLVADERQPATHRWAIIAADASSRPLADLLTAELSTLSNVQLVEREQIDRVLGELELNASGLVERDRATKFGRLSQADALLMVNTHNDPAVKQPHLRLRMVDTRTSVRLLDAVLPKSSIDEEVAAMREELQAVSATLSVPDDELKLISIVPIISGETGHLLKPYCHTLTALVEAEFHRRPEFVVLERSDLQRLTAESDLSGLELRLRGATRLLETSVRRTGDGKGIIATCQIGVPGGAESESVELQVSSREPTAARSLIVKHVLQKVGDNIAAFEPVDPEMEAKTLDRRARWLRGEQSVAMAEAALALAPTHDRLWRAIGANMDVMNRKAKAKQWFDSLLANHRSCELRLRYLQSYEPEFVRMTHSPIYYFYPNPTVVETDEERDLMIEVVELRKQILRKEYQYADDSPLDRLHTLLKSIDLELSWTTGTADPANVVAANLLETFELREAAGIPRDVSDRYYNEMVRSLIVAIDRAASADASDRWRVENFTAWVQSLEALDQRYVRAARLRAQTDLPGQRGEQAARSLIAHLHELPLVDAKHVDLPMRRAALARLSVDEVYRYFQLMLDRAEEQGDPSRVFLFGSEVGIYLDRLTTEQATQVSRRMIGMLTLDDGWETTTANVLMLTTISRFLPKGESPFRHPPEFSLEDAAGPWQNYRVVPIRLTNIPGNRRLRALCVRKPELGFRGGFFALAWSLPSNMTKVEFVAPQGGTTKPFGSVFAGHHRFGPLQIVVGRGQVFINSNRMERESTLTMLTRKATKVLTEQQGAASNSVTKIGWLNDRLYIAYQDAFGSYGPVNDQFELLASSNSVRPKNPIDARGSFLIRKMLPDEQNGCLWLAIQERNEPKERMGLWRCDPENNSYVKISGHHVDISLTDGDVLVHRNAENKIALVDGSTSDVTELPEFAHASGSTDIPASTFISPYTNSFQLPYPRPHLIKVGDHLISDTGKLFTRDGKTYELENSTPWRLLQRFGKGFVTHYERHRQTIWYVEPK